MRDDYSCSSLWIKEDRDVVGSEGTFAGGRTSANHSLVIFAGGEAVLQLTGNGIQAGCGVAQDEPRLTRACVASAHAAGLARVVSGFRNIHSGLCDDAGNGAFLLVECKDFDGAGEV